MSNRIRLFVSYSRRDKRVIKPLVSRLGARFDLWIDWEDIPAGADWEQEIERGIAQADVFLFFLTENSASSEWCNRELDKALALGKRVIPILFDREPPYTIPDACRRIQYCFPEQVASLDAILERRKDDARSHADILLKALHWQRRGKPQDLLLHGKALKNAVLWLRSSDDDPPLPTHLHREYVLSSQLAEGNRLAIVSTALVGILSIGSAFLLVNENLQLSTRRLWQASLTAVGLVGVGVLGLRGKIR